MEFKNEQDRILFQNRWKTVEGLFKMYGKGDDRFRVAGYTKVLMDVDLDDLQTACAYLLDTQKFLPAVSEIKAAVRIIKDMKDPDHRMLTWPEACLEIRNALRHSSIYKKPEFSRKEITDTVEQFGWVSLCTSDEAVWPFTQERLRKLYEANCMRKLELEGNIAVLQRTGRALPAGIDVKKIGDGK